MNKDDKAATDAEVQQQLASAVEDLRKHGSEGFVLFILTEPDNVRTIAAIKDAHKLDILSMWGSALHNYLMHLGEHAGHLVAGRLFDLLMDDEKWPLEDEDDEDD